MANDTREAQQGKRRVLFTELEVLLYAYDLADINFGSNPNEYAQEVRAILARLNEQSSKKEIKHIVYDIFVAYFSALCIPDKNHPIYTELSEEIWVLWQGYIEKGIKGPSLYDFIIQ